MMRRKAAHILDRLDPRNGLLAITSTFFTNSILMYSCEPDGRQMRGLYLLQSDTASTLACIGSRIFSHYRFRKIDLTVNESDQARRFTSTKAGIDVTISLETQTGVSEGSTHETHEAPLLGDGEHH